jgi:hypothetical protein
VTRAGSEPPGDPSLSIRAHGITDENLMSDPKGMLVFDIELVAT